ncbi:hypothetical protein, partial [Aeromonas veronii]|uniref:hypothetical protein n=1 Tax=Aeromonas veronii TaxID=654 RepID=UPI001F1F7AD2
TGYRQQKPKNGLTKCPDLVDHYMFWISCPKLQMEKGFAKQQSDMFGRGSKQQRLSFLTIT